MKETAKDIIKEMRAEANSLANAASEWDDDKSEGEMAAARNLTNYANRLWAAIYGSVDPLDAPMMRLQEEVANIRPWETIADIAREILELGAKSDGIVMIGAQELADRITKAVRTVGEAD